MTTTHTPVDVEVLALSECAAEDCEHENGCPTLVRSVCLECNTARQRTDDVAEWEGPVASCPVHGPEPTGPRVTCFCGEEHITGSCLGSTAPEHDPRCLRLTDSEYNDVCDCATLRMIDAHESSDPADGGGE